MTSPRPPRPARRGSEPVPVDAVVRQTMALLELVRQEEALLGWLDDCVAQLQAVRRARQTLLDFTGTELAQAQQLTLAMSEQEAAEPESAAASARSGLDASPSSVVSNGSQR